MRDLRQGAKGQVLVLVALAMTVLIALAALAIDVGRAYGVKAKLNAAVDAASYEAANALAQGTSESGMKALAVSTATTYFKANYPKDFLGAPSPAPVVEANRDPSSGKWQVKVSATSRMPTLFAGVIGYKTMDVSASSEAVRGTIDLVLVLDATMSLILYDPDTFNKVKEAAQNFVELLNEKDDRVSLVVFAQGSIPIVSICGQNPAPVAQAETLSCGRGFDRQRLKQAIGGLSLGRYTASSEGLKRAVEQLDSLKSPYRSGRRVIVFFSDGAPNTFNGRFGLRSGGAVEGNLFSGIQYSDKAHEVYDSSTYDRPAKSTLEVGLLPGQDLSGVPAVSYNHKRTLTGLTDAVSIKCDANAVARNMAENVASMARKDGIEVYTIGLGALTGHEMNDNRCATYSETGTTIMKRLANTTDSDSYSSSEPSGIFCKATDVAGLRGCFETVASAILRISK